MDFKAPLTFDEFAQAGLEAWRAQALKELKKESFDNLSWTTRADISLTPYYDGSTAFNLKPFHHHVNPPHDFSVEPRWWENRQIINYSSDEITNKEILSILAFGADGIIIKVNNPTIDFNKLLKEVKPAYCSISFITNEPEVGHAYLKYIFSHSDYKKIYGGLIWESTDQCQRFIEKGSQLFNLPESFRYVSFYDPAGNEVVKQLTSISTILDRCGDDHRELLSKRIALNVDLDQDFFQSLAFIKAARILLYQVLRSYHISIPPERIFIQALSPVYVNENYGPHENMLKSTSTALAALSGGCNSLVIIPSDDENMFLRRMAVNVSHILKEEAFMSKIVDPSAGSYFIDHLVELTVNKCFSAYQERVK